MIDANNTIFLFLLCCTMCATIPYIGTTWCATTLYTGATTCATKKKSDGTGISFKYLICLASPDPPQKVMAYIPYALYSCTTACATWFSIYFLLYNTFFFLWFLYLYFYVKYVEKSYDIQGLNSMILYYGFYIKSERNV